MAEKTFEVRFSELAEIHVRDKVPSLMDDWVGFQLLHKSEDEKNATGIMAFVLGKLWLYIPVIFVRGDIKGSNILYIQNLDLKVPAQDSWINSLREQGLGFLGNVMEDDDEDYFDSPEGVTIPLEELTVKTASASLIDQEDINKLFGRRAFKPYEFLDKIASLGDQAVVTFTNTMLKDPEFANAVLTYHSPDELEKLSSMLTGIQSRLSPPEEENPLVFINSMDDKNASDLTDSEKRLLISNGMFVKDARVNTTKVFTVNKAFENLNTPDESGYYELLMEDGTYIPVYIFKHLNEGSTIVVDKSGKPGVIYDSCKDLLARPIKEEWLKTKPCNKKALASMPYDSCFIVRKGDRSVEIRKTTTGYYTKQYTTVDPVFIGDRGKLSIHGNILAIPDGCEFLILGDEVDKKPGDLQTIDDHLKATGDFSPLHVRTDSKIGTRIKIEDDINTFPEKNAAIRYLTERAGIFAGQATQIMKEASREGGADYLLKLASPYDEGIKNPVRDRQVPTSIETFTQPDAQGLLPGQAVQAISQAAEAGIEEVFDVSVFKSLIQSANVGEFKQDFLHDMMRGMDSTASTLLLMYWNYDLFEERYGESLEEIESKLKDVFSNLGDLILFLKENTETLNEGGESVWGMLTE